MNSLKKSIDFLAKNFLVIIPLYVAAAVPMLVMGNIVMKMLSQFTLIFQSIMSGGDVDPTRLAQQLMGPMMDILVKSSLGSGLSLILSIIAVPITYGLIKRELKNPPTGLQFSMEALKETIVPYILYVIGTIILAIIAGIAIGIVSAILSLIFMNLGVIGIIILALYAIALILACIYFGVRITLWFPAMIMDNKGIMDGLKQGFVATKGSFWTLFGITVLITIVMGVVSFILSFLTGIPVIGPLISAAVSTLSSFILMVFYMIFYQEKTQAAAPPQDA